MERNKKRKEEMERKCKAKKLREIKRQKGIMKICVRDGEKIRRRNGEKRQRNKE